MELRLNLCVVLLMLINASTSSYIGSDGQNQVIGSNGTFGRHERVLPLFSRVRFSHSLCYGTDVYGDSYNGTCLTRPECNAYDGKFLGICAAGFGVCCGVVIQTCGALTDRNNSYWLNPDYYEEYGFSEQCTFQIVKSEPSICQIRLDFINFEISQPDASAKKGCATCTQCSNDMFTVSGQSNNVPVICGTNTGQHIYLDLAAEKSTVTMNMLVTGASTQRKWLIYISQIPCGASYAAPDGCLQWYTDISATFSSFNYQFSETPAVQKLANQDYTICIRTSKGYCGIRYEVCDEPSSVPALKQFLISAESADTVVDSACLTDFVQVPCGVDLQSANQLQSDGTGCVTKICGSAFSSVSAATSPSYVYSYRKPFQVRFYTDGYDTTTSGSIGFCLKYTQQTCSGSIG